MERPKRGNVDPGNLHFRPTREKRPERQEIATKKKLHWVQHRARLLKYKEM